MKIALRNWCVNCEYLRTYGNDLEADCYLTNEDVCLNDECTSFSPSLQVVKAIEQYVKDEQEESK